MKKQLPLGRWTVRTLAALALAGAVNAPPAPAQSPGQIPNQSTPRSTLPSAAPKKTYTKNTVFNLPIQMDEKTRANLDRVCLYVKVGTADWVRHDSAPPTLPHFTYRVQQDGEYCFTLVTIDRTGKAVPADVSTEPPSLRVVVDTKAPFIDMKSWTSPEGEQCLRCSVVDANPDLSSLRGFLRTPTVERLLEAYPGQPGVFKLSGADVSTTLVSVVASDLAGNVATRDLKLSEVLASAVQTAQLPGMTPLITKTDQRPMLPPLPIVKNELPDTDQTKIEPLKTDVAKTDVVKVEPPSIVQSALPPIPSAPLPEITQPTLPATSAPPMLPTMVTAAASPNTQPEPDVTPATPAGSPRQIINTAHAIVDYRIDQVGPSGVGKVEVYLTADLGQTWRRLAEDSDRRSPVEFDLPGEGVFGIRLVITNGNGFGGRAPQRGDSPTCAIEVDASAPFVQLRPIEPIVANGALEVRWQASDKNLSAEPVNLYYRARIDGPWQVIARGVKNDGTYRWNVPRDAAAQFFVKVEVTDLAGNTARAESSNPIVLDTTEPRATVVNVTGLSVRGGN